MDSSDLRKEAEGPVIIINISKDFGRFPGGRVPSDGPFSGEAFRNKHLAPAMREAISQGTSVEILLDGVEGYGSSFLEEAFGGLVRHESFTEDQIVKHLKLTSADGSMSFYSAMILDYVKDAEKAERK
jgi:hypothetical protein